MLTGPAQCMGCMVSVHTLDNHSAELMELSLHRLYADDVNTTHRKHEKAMHIAACSLLIRLHAIHINRKASTPGKTASEQSTAGEPGQSVRAAYLMPEPSIQQVQHSMLSATNIEVHRHPVLLRLRIQHALRVVGVNEAQVVPAGARPLGHGTRLPPCRTTYTTILPYSATSVGRTTSPS